MCPLGRNLTAQDIEAIDGGARAHDSIQTLGGVSSLPSSRKTTDYLKLLETLNLYSKKKPTLEPGNLTSRNRFINHSNFF